MRKSGCARIAEVRDRTWMYSDKMYQGGQAI